MASFLVFTGAKRNAGTYRLIRATILPHRSVEGLRQFMSSAYFQVVQDLIPADASDYRISEEDMDRLCDMKKKKFGEALEQFLELVGGARSFKRAVKKFSKNGLVKSETDEN